MANQIDLPFGYVRPYPLADNEVEHVTLIPDQAKYRFGILEHLIAPGSTSLGADSYNTVRPDGMHDEWATIGVRLIEHEGKRAAVIAFSVRDEDSQDVREVLVLSPYGAGFNVPAGLVQQPMSFTRSLGGNCEQHVQDDGNMVVYDVRPGVTVNGQPSGQAHGWVALWASRGGEIRSFREDGQYAD